MLSMKLNRFYLRKFFQERLTVQRCKRFSSFSDASETFKHEKKNRKLTKVENQEFFENEGSKVVINSGKL
jgi:hypothetical protein